MTEVIYTIVYKENNQYIREQFNSFAAAAGTASGLNKSLLHLNAEVRDYDSDGSYSSHSALIYRYVGKERSKVNKGFIAQYKDVLK